MRFLGTKPKIDNCNFSGNDTNIVYCVGDVTLINSTICFYGSNATIILCQGTVQANFIARTNSLIYIGPNNYFPTCYYNMINPLISSDIGTKIVIGSECPVSTGVCIETGDGHDMFDIHTGENISRRESIYIGDAVWLGRDSHILKGTIINTGSIVGAGAVVTGDHLNTGEVWAGVPARCIKIDTVYGHMDQPYLGYDNKYKYWNSIDSFKYNEKEEITIEQLKKFTVEDFLNLKLANGRFIWKV